MSDFWEHRWSTTGSWILPVDEGASSGGLDNFWRCWGCGSCPGTPNHPEPYIARTTDSPFEDRAVGLARQEQLTKGQGIKTKISDQPKISHKRTA